MPPLHTWKNLNGRPTNCRRMLRTVSETCRSQIFMLCRTTLYTKTKTKKKKTKNNNCNTGKKQQQQQNARGHAKKLCACDYKLLAEPTCSIEINPEKLRNNVDSLSSWCKPGKALHNACKHCNMHCVKHTRGIAVLVKHSSAASTISEMQGSASSSWSGIVSRW